MPATTTAAWWSWSRPAPSARCTRSHVWVSRAWGRQPEDAAKRNRDPLFALERPERADARPHRARLGPLARPRPERPFHEVYYPGPKWYRWWDFGNGTMSDLGSHWNDLAVLGAEAQRAPDDRGLRTSAAPRDRPGLDAHRLRVRPARRHAAGHPPLVPGRGEARDLARGRHPQVGRRRAVRRRQGDDPVQLLQARPAPREGLPRLHPARADPSPSRSATGPSGSTPARPAHRRPATSTTPAGSPRPTTWATSLTAPARRSSGTRPRWRSRTPPRPKPSSTGPTARVGRWPECRYPEKKIGIREGEAGAVKG